MFGLTKIIFRFRPRLLDDLGRYNRQTLVHDVSAGITVGIVALPLAMAFAIASGLPPQAGLFTAIVAGFLISALGGSSVQIGGPAGAFIVVVFAIVERWGVANLMIATMFAGILMVVMGVLRWGNLVRLIPVSIVLGFTNGIAVLIGLSQVKDFLGLEIAAMPADFFQKISAISGALHTVNGAAVFLAVLSLVIVVLWPKSYTGYQTKSQRLIARLPGTLVALSVGTFLATVFNLQVATIGSAFGEIPQGLPALSLPTFEWQNVRQLTGPILTIAFLGAVESLLCARVADSMTRSRHDPNQELMAQGIANIASPLFGGFCATGTVARTVTNIRAGAKTQVSGMVHALTLLLIMLGAAPLATNIPLATLSGLLMFVAWNMGDWKEFARLKQFSFAYKAVFISTFVLTVVVDITVAVEVGLILACVFYIARMSQVTNVELLSAADRKGEGFVREDIEVARITGSLFFGAISKFEALAGLTQSPPKVLVLDLTNLIHLDSTGLDAISSLTRDLMREGTEICVVGLSGQPLDLAKRAGFLKELGEEKFLKERPNL